MENKELLERLYRLLDAGTGKDVLCVYVVGSRLYRTNRKDNADYDLKVVLKDNAAFFSSPRRRDFSDDLFDLHIYSASGFAERLEKQDPQVLICLFVPPAFVWKEDKKFNYWPRLKKLYKTAFHEADTNWSKAFRLWKRRARLLQEGISTSSKDHEDENDQENGKEEDTPESLHYRAQKVSPNHDFFGVR